ncbi:MAG: anaerobic ribonucleoside-triphosphate reductase [Parcubacteria group bacterium]|jgi:ribonucleoside-triphosphate reductase
MKKQICHDCKKELENNDEVAKYETNSGEFFKCRKCHTADSVLRNFQETEVYSRIVGYIRPVSQWNAGKAEEYKDRKEYKPATCC